MASPDKIRFLHIPKSAGTSFSNCLRRLYKANRFKRNSFVFLGDFERDVQRYHALTETERSKLVFVSGHVPLMTGIQSIDGLPTITFLRDPVARVKSLCQHISEGKVWNVDANQNIDAYLADPCNIWIDNLQTRTLLGNAGYELPEASEDAIVAQALDILENRLACFGITEYFDDSLLLFKHSLGWQSYPVYTKLNQKSEHRLLQFSEAQSQAIRDRNRIDIKVYEAALRLFKSRLAADAGVIEASRKQFAIRQRIFEPILGVYQLYHKLQSRRNKS
ncbi:sulfotransferase family 2 domain-containing protein [Methylomagnum sp.]